ncbi:MFS transporter [Ammoniphilus sp. 3BR4]|uniref:MFS transporter n=1 Tax=Ammoniphilus sp. 3BR4 TaxID=3158265 RepID=UPI003466321A
MRLAEQIRWSMERMPKANSILFLKGQNFFFFASLAIIVTYLPLYFKEIGLRANEIGFILAIGPFISIVGQPFWGIVADRTGSIKRTVLLLTICTSLLWLGVFWGKSFYVIFFFMAFFMFFMTSIGPLTESLNVHMAMTHGVNYGSIRAWGSIGFSLSAVGIGAILSVIGLSSMAILYIAFMILIIVFSRRTEEISNTNRNKMEIRDIQILLKNGPFLKFLLLVMIVAIPHRLNDNWLGIYLSQLGASNQMVGAAWMLSAGAETIVFLFFSSKLENYQPKVLLLVSTLLYSLRWFLYSLVSSPGVLLLFQTFHAITFAIFFSTCLRYLAQLVPERLSATGQGLFASVFGGVSGILGSLLGGWMMEAFNGSMMYRFAAFLSLLGAVCIIISGKSRKV